MCGTPIPMDERFCSPKCEQILAERQRKVAKTRKIIYIAFAALIIIYLLYTLKGKVY
jgi:predicted nucleic acid-binding Zn ribbon protein